MLAGIRARLTFANVTSVMALCVALGGTSYAAVQLSNNSVRSKHIVNGQVKNADLAKGAVTSAKVKDGSLLSKDFKNGQLVAGARGPAGPTGDPGPKGDTGPQGTPGSGFDWQGAWSALAQYRAGDVVSYDGSSYIATQANAGTQPGGSRTWDLLARKGDNGPPGMSGYERITVTSPTNDYSAKWVPVTCPGTKRPVDAGINSWQVGGGPPDPWLSVVVQGPSEPHAVHVLAVRQPYDGVQWSFDAYAICVNVAR